MKVFANLYLRQINISQFAGYRFRLSATIADSSAAKQREVAYWLDECERALATELPEIYALEQ